MIKLITQDRNINLYKIYWDEKIEHEETSPFRDEERRDGLFVESVQKIPI